MSLCLPQLILCKFALREMLKRLVAQPGLGLGPRLNLALCQEAVECIAKPYIEACIITPASGVAT